MRDKTLAICGVGLVIALAAGLVYALLTRSETLTAHGTAPSATPATTTAPEPTPSPEPTPTATPTATREPGVAVSEFVAAWLETDPAARVEALEATAIPHLAALLVDTDPARIPAATPDGVPREIPLPAGAGPEHSADAQRWAQDLSDETTVWVDIIPDPERGWLAAAIQPATR